jgi:hypothetical protein
MRCKECGREFFPIRKECEILLRHLSSAGISETKKETRLEENGAFDAPFSAPPTTVRKATATQGAPLESLKRTTLLQSGSVRLNTDFPVYTSYRQSRGYNI